MAEPTDQSTLSRYVNQSPSVRFVILVAGAIIILAATYAAASFLVPILLSVLFAVVFWPPLVWLEKRGLSSGLALGVVLLGVVVISLILLGFLWITIGSFGESLPEYRASLATQMVTLREIFRGWGIELRPVTREWRVGGRSRPDPNVCGRRPGPIVQQRLYHSVLCYLHVGRRDQLPEKDPGGL